MTKDEMVREAIDAIVNADADKAAPSGARTP